MRVDSGIRKRFGRRHLLRTVAGGLAGSVLFPRRSSARLADVAPLDDRLTLVSSGGTNVVALATADGLVLVDSGAPEQSERLLASLSQMSSGGRVSKVFNTHWHLENTGANEALRQRGATLVAHENTRLWMATPVWVPADDRYRPARPKAAQPTETFRLDGSLTAGRDRIDYGYLIEAHTSGDIYVYFRDANVLAVGDVASPTRDPELDYFTGAWLGGRVDALAKLLKLADANTRIVPGFGPVMSRADVQAEHDTMKKIFDRAVDRIRQGDDAGDMLDAGVMNGLPRTWKDPRKFLYDVQKGLWAHHNKLNPNVV
ncbi:MAG TPA: MBL fold metallo-hydrolase [Vicinamibacterales bacterium]|nr:MBL fold metallo-hydrolase [Vicinamibacterales bacterium]